MSFRLIEAATIKLDSTGLDILLEPFTAITSLPAGRFVETALIRDSVTGKEITIEAGFHSSGTGGCGSSYCSKVGNSGDNYGFSTGAGYGTLEPLTVGGEKVSSFFVNGEIGSGAMDFDGVKIVDVDAIEIVYSGEIDTFVFIWSDDENRYELSHNSSVLAAFYKSNVGNSIGFEATPILN